MFFSVFLISTQFPLFEDWLLLLTTIFTFLFCDASFLCACGPLKSFLISSKCLLLVSGTASLNNQHATCKLSTPLAASLNFSLIAMICIFQ